MGRETIGVLLNVHHHINYVELYADDLDAVVDFYSSAFGWSFQRWGDSYVAFSGAGLEGGFGRSGASATSRSASREGPLVILYSDDLSATEAAVGVSGGSITVPAYDFPGGRRFHFTDPAGNELAVWSPPVEDDA